MYADDTVLFSESREGLQYMLNQLERYSNEWNIEVNVDKTKIVVFRSAGRLSRNDTWHYDNQVIEVVNFFNYLGLTLSYNGKFGKTQNIIAMQGRKCVFGITKVCNENYLNTESKLSVFDTYVSSVLNYGSEIWGFHNAKDIETVHTKYCKQILKVKRNTPNFMVYCELGRLPMIVIRKLRIIKYWVKLLKTNNCILQNIYEEMNSYLFEESWVYKVKELLCGLGLYSFWLSQTVPNEKLFLFQVKQRLTDQFI